VSPEALDLSKTLKPSKTPNAARKKLINQFPFRSLDNTQPAANAPKTGTINNIVVFIRFSGEAGYTDPISTYSSMFNSTTTGANSMRNYFAEASYNQLTVSTTFYPTQTGTTVISYQDGQPRGYYQPYSVTNTIGYDPNVAWNDWSNTNGSSYREFSLINHATNAINSLVPTSLNIDGDGDGNVDNVCFIISGSPGAWSSLLWPHQWSLYYQNAYINNKRVFTYNFQLRDFTLDSRIGVGVLAHEMFHSLGAPDLYHYSQVEPAKSLHPAGPWDLMDSNMNPPEHMTAYMKQRYGNWIASIPTITTSGTYTLNSLTSANDNAYRINSPNTTTEYFIVEYRRRTGTFEASLPGEGLIVYRINTAKDGEGNSDGPPDEVYIFRPGGTVTANGVPDSANFGSAVSRTAINDSTNPSSFLSNGGAGGLNISNVGTVGSTISFTVTIGGQATFDLVAVSYSGEVYKINPITSQGIKIGDSGFTTLNSLARDNTGNLISATDPGWFNYPTPSTLIKIDPVTGLGSVIATVSGGVNDIRAIAFSPSGELFASTATVGGDISNKNTGIYKINEATGAVTYLGGSTLGEFQGLAFSPNGTLYGWSTHGDPTGDFYAINTSTGIGTKVGNSGGNSSIQDLTFGPNGILYGVGAGKLYSINVTTGIPTLIGSNTSSYDLRGIAVLQTVPIKYTLTVTTSGQGTVTSNPVGIDCGTDCIEDYASGIKVTLTAATVSGYTFVSWGGDCSGTTPSCVVSMTAVKNVTATFNQIQSNNPGGTANSLNGEKVVCSNLSTRQVLGATVTNNSWDCAASALTVSPGDRISMTIKGVAQ